ncbi:hypothetical protein OQA88_5131 [Cercophora sp. LCS_1]
MDATQVEAAAELPGIVVERLTKNINEDHIREIFGQYGEIEDLDLPISRQYGTNRGTAYILYTHEADAESAIAHMHEAQLDGAVINVSIVLPRRKLSPGPARADLPSKTRFTLRYLPTPFCVSIPVTLPRAPD